MTTWLDSRTHRLWLDGEFRRLVGFGRRVARGTGGANYLGLDGTPDTSTPLATYLTARVVHAMGVAALAGVPGARPIAQRVFAGLTGPLHDDEHGGWFHTATPEGPVDAHKSCYENVHALLGASTAVLAGLEGAEPVFAEASAVVAERFWDDDLGLLRDGFTPDWSRSDPYIGANANMHGVEAMLAAYDVSGDGAWLERASRIVGFFADQARPHDWRLPEHYDANARVQLDYNADSPDDRFKPYGATVGHGFEWSRLVLHLEAALGRMDGLLEVATGLFDRAAADGWAVDGVDGFVYTTDFSGRPVTTTRLWWVAAEAIGAAACLARRTGEPRYAAAYATWWDHVATCFVDLEQGSWHHELGSDLQPSHTIWNSKEDLYHTTQATLIPRLPLTPCLARAVADGLL